MVGNDDNNDQRKDLTRIEDLSEFFHQEDPDVDSKFKNLNDGVETDELPALPEEVLTTETNQQSSSHDGALDSNESFSLPEEIEQEQNEISLSSEEEFKLENLENEQTHENQETSEDEFSLTTNYGANEEFLNPQEGFSSAPESNDLNSTYGEVESKFPEIQESLDFTPEFQESATETSDSEYQNQIQTNESFEEAKQTESYPTKPEKFEEIKSFVQTFSYGQISTGGNPPFSVIVRHIKFEEDAHNILQVLKEFSIVNEKNLEETKYALELGSLIIPQISEYAAIVVAHKLRRFDCDVEVGLSEEIHPPKGNESLPKGLTKKSSIKQNISDQYKKNSLDQPIESILMTTMSHLEGYEISKYLGVQTTSTLVEEEDLERLLYVQKTQRENSTFSAFGDGAETSSDSETKHIFSEYQKSFDLLFIDLMDQLKQKAQKERANALLGITFQITPLPLKKLENSISGYQLLCSATLALVTPQ